MARQSVEELRAAIVADTAELAVLADQRDALRRQATEVAREHRKVATRRERRIKRARESGATTEQLAADAKVTAARIRQIAPIRKKGPGAAAVAEQLADVPAAGPFARTAEQRERVEQLATAGAFVQTAKLKTDELRGIVRAARDIMNATASANLPIPPEPDEQLNDDEPLDPESARLMYDVITEATQATEEPDVDERQADDEPEQPAASSSARRPRRKLLGDLEAERGVDGIAARVRAALEQCGGDVEQATAALVATAVPDAMRLLDASRAGAAYDYTAHPSIPAPLKRPGRKQADMIWEGRPRFVNRVTLPGMHVDVLDVNGAYLSALRRVHLPIGRLVEDPPGTPFDRRRSGIYLIEPIVWRHKGMPNPLGDGREESGPVWISGATMRLLHRAAKLGYGMPPAILESHTSGASENLLTKFGDTLAAARRAALAARDDVLLDYVKAMYSKFVSTSGDSRANHSIFRPDWVHEIRSQAYANLWYKAEKVRRAGIVVCRMNGTDELHLSAAWRHTLVDGKPLFALGRDLAEMKVKGSYVWGERD